MYLVAICDDEEKELDRLQHYLTLWQNRFPDHTMKIRRFKNAEELLNAVEENGYTPDFILLDIYMREKSGITAAEELREMGSESDIIFLTASREHALDAFRVYASQYVVKPITEEVLFPILDRVFLREKSKQKNHLLFRIDGRNCRVALHDIVFCEAQGKYQWLELRGGIRRQLRMTITEIYGMLSGYPEFVRVGASYIINLDHVDSLNARQVCLDTGKNVYLPRGAYQPLREKYFQYYCEDSGD